MSCCRHAWQQFRREAFLLVSWKWLFPERDHIEYTKIKNFSYSLISLYLYDILAIVVMHDKTIHGLYLATDGRKILFPEGDHVDTN